MIAPAPQKKQLYWYDIVVCPFENVAVCCEQVEMRGWQIHQVFSTGVMAKVQSHIMTPGAPEQTTALIAVLCRTVRKNDVKPSVFPPEMMAKNVVDGKFPPPPPAAEDHHDSQEN
jgi:hypothetical protein